MTISQNFVNLRPSLLLDFSNTEQLDPRVSFSRPTTATYYDANTTALAEQNLILQSQALATTPWTVNGAAATNNTTTAPDGNTTAATLLASSGSNTHYILQIGSNNLSGLVCTQSVYLKAGTNNFSTVSFSNPTSAAWISVTANLSTGVITQTNNGSSGVYTSSSITSVGSGWYRVSVTGYYTGTTTFYAVISLNSSATPTIGNYGLETWVAAGTETIYAWGAQLEQRSSVTAYNATTTTAITNYIPVLLSAPTNQARFDHDPVARTSLGLLIEQQSTNLFLYSVDFTNSYWTKDNVSLTPTANIAPDGTQSAQLVTASSSTFWRISKTGITGITSINIVQSIYVKKGNADVIGMNIDGNVSVTYTFSTNVFSSVGTSVVSTSSTSVGNGWFRLAVVLNTPAWTPSPIRLLALNDTCFIWGAQLEALAFPTSYIPTVASQVTRSADSASMTGTNFSSWYNPAGGTVYSEFILRNTAAFQPSFSINSGTNANEVILGGLTTTGYYVVYANGTVQFNANPTVGAINTTTKASTSFLNNTVFGVSFNGAAATNSASSLITAQNVNILLIGNETQQRKMNGTIKKLMFYPVAATNTQLQALTGS